MAILNLKYITMAVESILKNNLFGYTIERNPERNEDPNVAAKGSGWIGIYRGPVSYDAHTTGSTPWLVGVNIRVEVQVASMKSSEDAEDRLQDSEEEVLTVLNNNRTLNGTVAMINGYDIDYEFNEEERIYFHASIIIIRAEVRS